MVALGLCCYEQASSSGVRWGYSLVAVHGFSLGWLLVEAQASRQVGFRGCGSQDCSVACGIFPDQGLDLCPLHWQVDC